MDQSRDVESRSRTEHRRDQRYLQLARALRSARTSSGLTQVELARRLGKRQAFVSKVELGERRLDVIELADICRAIGVSLVEVLPEAIKETLLGPAAEGSRA